MTNESQRVLQALTEARLKLEQEDNRRHEPLAIIGMGCRFPGEANTPKQYWDMLCAGTDAVGAYPKDRFADGFDANMGVQGGFLNNIDQFDPTFFGISPKEADGIDPQQRLLLETSWEALENSGYIPQRLEDNNTGVFVGITLNDYSRLLDPAAVDAHFISGNNLNAAAGRISYVFGFSGPCMAIDTACSSSLVAVHQACLSLRNRECDMAIAGGVNVILSPQISKAGLQSKMLAPDGRCKTFDASADGIGRSEGCGTVIIKRLSDAQADGDKILATIRGTATNCDGASSGFMVPNGKAQQQLILQAMRNGRLQAKDVSYIEAHGTGTRLGDPIELGALTEVFTQGRNSQSNPLLVGSVKSNMGHLESAAGIAGLIKMVLALQARQLPGNLHFKQQNPLVDWKNGVIEPVTELRTWGADTESLIAGISSFGASGTNAHVIVEQAPEVDAEILKSVRPAQVFTLSAKSEPALKKLAQNYSAFFKSEQSVEFSDICFTATSGRSHFHHRLAVMDTSVQEIAMDLDDFVAGIDNKSIFKSISDSNSSIKPVFLFTGQGAQYVNMGLQLYLTEDVFKGAVDKCSEILADDLEYSLIDVMYPELTLNSCEQLDPELIHQTQYTQPALFAFEYALTSLWRSWGVEPKALMGHSVGEYVAACIAGIFSLEDGLKLIAARGRLMQRLPESGSMLVVLSSLEKVEQAIVGDEKLSIAAINGPDNIVISGAKDAISGVSELFNKQGIATHQLSVSHAFHSPLMAPMIEPFRQIARSINYYAPQLRIVSNLTAGFVDTEMQSADYWCRHILEPVQFSDGIQSMEAAGFNVFLEIGPTPVLIGMGQRCVADSKVQWLSSLQQGHQDHKKMLTSLATLYTKGTAVNWKNFNQPYSHRHTDLPTYPFERQRCWLKAQPVMSTQIMNDTPVRQGYALPGSAHHPNEYIWEEKIDATIAPFLSDHRLEGVIAIPGGMLMEVIYSAINAFFNANNYELQDVEYLQMLFLPEGVAQTIQVVLSESTNQELSFCLYSQSSDSGGSSWIKNGTGKAVIRNELVA